ncbi:MAG: hypothetical protein J6Y48_21030 [Clostridia bacterium]|nr:hypothetical protein [Clostridia bacterium]
MKKMIVLTVALCILVCFAACAEPAGSGFLADFDTEVRYLEEYNPFLPVIRQHVPGFDALCAELREKVRTSCSSAETLYRILSDLFARIGNPGHLNMIDRKAYWNYVWLAETKGRFADGPETRLLDESRTCGLYEVQNRPEETDEPDLENRNPVSVSYDPGRKMLYICIRSFSEMLMERDRDLLLTAFRDHPDAEHIVFDICGNSGGSDYYWEDLLVAPFGETVTYSNRAFFTDNRLTEDYGLMEAAVPVSTLSSEEIPAFVDDLGLTHTLSWTRSIIPPEDSSRTVRSGAKRWVLTDELVFSAADGFAEFCRQTNWATVVGRRTKGDGGGVAPYLLRLPETGLLLRFTAAATSNREGELNTFYGTNPDILPKPSESPQDAVLRIIDALARTERP